MSRLARASTSRTCTISFSLVRRILEGQLLGWIASGLDVFPCRGREISVTS